MVAWVPAFFRLTGPFSSYRPFFVLPGKPGIYDGGWRRTVGTGCPRHDDGGVGTGLFSSYRGDPVSTTEDGTAPWAPGVPGTTMVAWVPDQVPESEEGRAPDVHHLVRPLHGQSDSEPFLSLRTFLLSFRARFIVIPSAAEESEPVAERCDAAHARTFCVEPAWRQDDVLRFLGCARNDNERTRNNNERARTDRKGLGLTKKGSG